MRSVPSHAPRPPRGSHVQQRAALLAALIVLLALAVACGGRASGKGQSDNGAGAKVTLRLGYFANVTHATAIVGVASGIFASNLGPNVNLQTTTFNAGGDEVQAFFSNALDAGYMGPNPTVNAYVKSQGDAVRVISGATAGGAFLIVQPGIHTAADLKGKTVATPQLGNTQDVALRTWLNAQGLKTDAQGGGDVAIVPQGNADTLNAFKAGSIAGAWAPEPWASRLLLEGGAVALVDERTLWPHGAYVTTQLVVRTAFMQQHPDVVAALLRGQIEANAFVNAQPQQAQRTVNGAIATLTGQRLSEPVLAAAWKNLTFTNDPLASSLKQAARDAAALGFVNLAGNDLDGLYALGPLNGLLRAANQPEVASQ